MSFKETEFGKIYSDCKVFNLDEVYTFSSGLSKSRKEFGFGNPFVTFKDVFYNYFLPENLSELANTNEKEISKCSVKRGDVFLTRTSETSHELGKSSVALKDYPNATFNGFTKRLRPKLDGIILPEYAGYYFRSNLFRNQINSMVTMTTRASLNNDTMAKLKIVVPKIDEQKAIAKILSDLDEKIEINNKINKNLEEMAQSIFKQWFVDFEFPNEEGKPYKSSGGEMVESELGMIPKIFSISTLGNEVKTIDNRGKTPPLEKEKTEYPIIDVKVLAGSSRIINYNNCLKFVNEETYKIWFRSGHPLENDILISTVGSLAELKMFFGNKGCIAQNVVALRCINISPFYMYEYLKYIKPKLVSYNIGSVQPSIKITHIMKHNIIIPDKNIVLKYDNLIKSTIEKIYNNENENERLEKLRDTLVPKLMSGEIRVPLENIEN